MEAVSYNRDAFLEIIRTGDSLRFTFLDRSRPSLSFEQSLSVPTAVFGQIADRHREILHDVSKRISRTRGIAEASSHVTNNSVTRAIYALSDDVRSALFPEDLLAHVRDFAPTSLLIRTNCPEIPWELSRINGDVLGLKLPTGRGLVTQRPLRRLVTRKPKRVNRVLLLVNPTGDLVGADREKKALENLFSKSPFFEFFTLSGTEVTLENLTRVWNSGNFDIIHYAGHSDAVDEEHGELLLYDGPVNGQYLAKLFDRNPPEFVFLNSCSSGVVSGSDLLFDDLIGLAPSLLRVGVGAVLGAAWPVVDKTAVKIAQDFYSQIGEGVSVGSALNAARKTSNTSVEVPYWLGYALFGDPDLLLRDDNSWKVSEVRSGGRAAATSTFSGRASLHVSSLHSFLMSCQHTDTSALAFACECTDSEALIHDKDKDLAQVSQKRQVKIAVPGATGSSIFARKISAEIGLEPDQCSFIELDTSEVKIALEQGVIDATVLWYPGLVDVELSKYTKRFSEKGHNYTICVLIGRTPRTENEIEQAHHAADAFSKLCRETETQKRKWSMLLAEQLAVKPESLSLGLDAFDFSLGGEKSFDKLPPSVRSFIDKEILYLVTHGFLRGDDAVHERLFPLAGSYVVNESNTPTELVADIQWSISSLPLLVGKFQRIYK
ncbi:MAG: CHAT domain-containing protein [Pseudomonadota bacterium]